MTRRLVVLAIAVAVAAGWFVVTAPTGDAAGNLETAWWWQGEAQSGAVPPPPTVPDGGLWVSSNASGPQSVSAVRVTLSPGEAAPVLTLDVRQSVPPSGVDLTAYPTTAAWSAGPAQAWSSKPAYDANGVHASGAMSTDGKKVTFDLSGLVTGDVLSVVIAPAAAAAPPPPPLPTPPPAPPTFDVTFEKPGPAALHVAEGSPEATDTLAPLPDSTPAPESVDTLPTPATSFEPAAPVGLSAPLPAVATAPNPVARATPPVAFRSGRRLLVPTAAKRSFGDSAAIAVMLGIVLLWVARDTSAGGAVRRPRLSLYDAPKAAEALAVPRTGTAPPLR